MLVLFLSATTLVGGQSPVQVPDGFPSLGQPPRFTVLSQGANPRTALRFVVPGGYRGRLNLDLARIDSAGVLGWARQTDLPFFRIGVDLTIQRVVGDELVYRFAFGGAEMHEPGSEPRIVGELRNVTDSSVGVVTISNRGFVRAAIVEATDLLSLPLPFHVATLVHQYLLCAFPEEAIGVGARWEVREAVDWGGAMVFQKSECAATAVAADSVTLTMRFDQTVPPQPVWSPFAGDVVEDSITAAGFGRVTVPLNSLVPTGEITTRTVTVRSSMRRGAAGPPRVFTTVSTDKVFVSPGRN